MNCQFVFVVVRSIESDKISFISNNLIVLELQKVVFEKRLQNIPHSPFVNRGSGQISQPAFAGGAKVPCLWTKK